MDTPTQLTEVVKLNQHTASWETVGLEVNAITPHQLPSLDDNLY